MPLRRILGLSAAVSGHLRRRFSTAASHPPWAMVEHTSVARSLGQRAWFELAEPPCVSNLRVPEHLVDAQPSFDPYGDHIADICGSIRATSGDGFFLLDFLECHVTAPIVATHGTTQERKIIDYPEPEPNVTRFVCNPISGELFRLPDIDGTKRSLSCHHRGLLTQSARGHGPPDRQEGRCWKQDFGGCSGSFKQGLGEMKSTSRSQEKTTDCSVFVN